MQEIDNPDGTKPQVATNVIPNIKSRLSFIWWCPECGLQNSLEWYAWRYCNGLKECVHCEKAVRVCAPWE